MERIESKDNRILKLVRKLSKRKYRELEGKFLVEGRKNLLEAFSAGGNIETILLREDAELPEDLAQPAKVFVLSEKLFRDIADTETSQGILGIVQKPDVSKAHFLSHLEDGNIVVLDQLQDPGNVGTILRTALGAGYEGAVILDGTCDIFSPKVVRATAGAVFRIPIVFVGDDRELYDLVKQAGKKLVVTSVVNDMPYYEADLTGKTALVIGNEGNGVRPELLEGADVRVSIPMQGNLESLNASVAAGILMYETVRGIPSR